MLASVSVSKVPPTDSNLFADLFYGNCGPKHVNCGKFARS